MGQETLRSADAEQSSVEPAEGCSLSAQAVDFCPYRRCQDRIRCAPAKFAELMLEVLLGLRRDIPTSSFPLEFGDKLSGYSHLSMIGEFAAPASGRPAMIWSLPTATVLASSWRAMTRPIQPPSRLITTIGPRFGKPQPDRHGGRSNHRSHIVRHVPLTAYAATFGRRSRGGLAIGLSIVVPTIPVTDRKVGRATRPPSVVLWPPGTRSSCWP